MIRDQRRRRDFLQLLADSPLMNCEFVQTVLDALQALDDFDETMRNLQKRSVH